MTKPQYFWKWFSVFIDSLKSRQTKVISPNAGISQLLSSISSVVHKYTSSGPSVRYLVVVEAPAVVGAHFTLVPPSSTVIVSFDSCALLTVSLWSSLLKPEQSSHSPHMSLCAHSATLLLSCSTSQSAVQRRIWQRVFLCRRKWWQPVLEAPRCSALHETEKPNPGERNMSAAVNQKLLHWLDPSFSGLKLKLFGSGVTMKNQSGYWFL